MSVYDEIRAEREHQQQRWGNEADDTLNSPWMWTSYITQYATRWMAGFFLPLKRDATENFRASMVKVASIAVAAVESIDRQRAANGRTHFEEA